MTLALFRRLAWINVAYLVFVILFGAWVRIAGAGAGCGDHWPMCNGEVIPQSPGAKTIIEFTHRLTSGLCGPLALALLWYSRRAGGSPRLFRAALATFFFLILEGLLGAVLVKKQLVVDDASVSRALVVGIHLTNTLLLTACATATAWWTYPPLTGRPGRRGAAWVLPAVLAALILTNITGAVTALGDTLFPTQPTLGSGLFARIREDLSPGQHFLVQLRIVHPIVASMTALLLIGGAAALRRLWTGVPRVQSLLGAALGAAVLQVMLGLVNISLAAPGWMQIIHLLTAQIVWILAVCAWLATREA